MNAAPYRREHDAFPPSAANYRPLTPLGFLSWAATVYPETVAVIYGEQRISYSQFYARCCRLADGLRQQGIGEGDVVAILAPNTPPMLEMHYAVPMLGAILCPVSTMKDAASVAYVLEHSEAKILFADQEYGNRVREALSMMVVPPIIIDIFDATLPKTKALGKVHYDQLIEQGNPTASWSGPSDEWQTISLNYTLGTTRLPKGVMFHHRGAYLDATAEVISSGMRHGMVYLWTLPMCRANGWCNSWAVTSVAGTHICMRYASSVEDIYQLIDTHNVTHLGGKKGFVSLLAQGQRTEPFPHTIRVDVVDSNQHPHQVDALEALGFEINFLYGLTETYGPAAMCQWHKDGEIAEGGRLLAHPAAHYPTLDALEVVDSETLQPLPADGRTVGEIVIRGNTLFKGYWKDEEATAAAFKGGVFHTGDLGVLHPDGHLEITHRSRLLEPHAASLLEPDAMACESLLSAHAAVQEAVIVPIGQGERFRHAPLAAFVILKSYAVETTEEELKDYCTAHLDETAVPARITICADLPRNEDGEVCFYQLQEKLAA